MKKLINFRLPFIIALSIIVGISFGYFIFISKTVIGIIILSIFCACTIAYLINALITKKYFMGALVFTLCALFMLTGITSFNHTISRYETFDFGDHYYTAIEGRVESVKQTQNGYQLILDDVYNLENTRDKIKGKLSLYINGETNADIGDVVWFGAYVSTKTAVYDNRLSSSYIERNIKYTAMLTSEQAIQIKYNDKTIFETINVAIRDVLKEGLQDDEFAIAYALLTGNSEYFDDDVITNFRQAGVAHIFAVSGLHIGFLSGALVFIFKKLKLNKYITAGLIICSLFFYSGICGFSASSIRASIMCSVMLIVKLFGEKYDGISSLSISATVILVSSPIQLLCVGFQLSFLVVFGILSCSPFLKSLFKRLPNKIASSLATVIPAYLFGIPISLYAFGEFSTIAIIVNFVFIPVVAVIFIMLLVTTVLAMIIGYANIILFIPNYVLKAVAFIIGLVDYDVFMVGGFTFGVFSLAYYLAPLVACGFFNFKKISKAIISIILALICALGVTLKTVDYNDKTRLIVSGGANEAIAIVDAPKTDVMIVSDFNRYASASAIKRAVSKTSAQSLWVVFLNIDDLDVQEALTKIYSVIKIDRVYFYQDSSLDDEDVIEIIHKSFVDTKAFAYQEGEELVIGDTMLRIDYLANSIRVKYNDKCITIFKKFNANYAGYDRLDYVPNVIIAHDYLENIYGYYRPSEMIAFRENSMFLDCEKHGNYIYSLD